MADNITIYKYKNIQKLNKLLKDFVFFARQDDRGIITFSHNKKKEIVGNLRRTQIFKDIKVLVKLL